MTQVIHAGLRNLPLVRLIAMRIVSFATIVALASYGATRIFPEWSWNFDVDQLISLSPSTDGASEGVSTQNEIPGGTPIETCETDVPHLLDIERVTFDPNPPQPGENLTVSASGIILETIEDGAYVDVIVRYGFIQLVRQRYDLCELLPEVDLECPVNQGYLSLTRTVELPSGVPPGEYYLEAHAYTQDDKLLTCLTATVEFGGDA